ncbi:MAG: hypothetical protein ACE145_14370 [Terriglobia bacterium]
MREHPDHHDAELLLKLYDLRREEKLRQARKWFVKEFHPKTLEEVNDRFPMGSQENDYFRMLISYWEMAASIVNNGLIKEEFFFENTAEFFLVWERLKPIITAARTNRKNPHLWANLEALAGKYEKWMKNRAPEALDVFRKLIVGSAPPKS